MPALPIHFVDQGRRPLEPAVLKSLAKLTRDGRARIVYGMQDQRQPIPHTAVILHGQKIHGWVLQGYTEYNIDGPGKLAEATELLLLAEPEPGRGSWTDLQVLRRWEKQLDAELREHEHSSWNHRACEDLTYSIGMVELLRIGNPRTLDHKDRQHYVKALVPKEKSFDWEAVALATARFQAEMDLRAKAFWTLPSSRHSGYYDRETVHLSTINTGFMLDRTNEFSERQILGAVEFVIQDAERNLRMWRHNSDNGWTLSVNVHGRIHSTTTYPFVAGAKALAVVLDAWRTRTPPKPVLPEDFAAENQAFRQYVADRSIAARRLDFVAKALDLPDPLQSGAQDQDAAASA